MMTTRMMTAVKIWTTGTMMTTRMMTAVKSEDMDNRDDAG